jgi:hypothetical protein
MGVSGPFFDSRAEVIMVKGERALRSTMADEADRRVGVLHRRFFKLPTPYYWTKVHPEARGDVNVVTDGGIVYGPWLEGTGSRNSPVTRFPGYRSARLTAQGLRNARMVTDPVVRDICREMNA